MNIDEWAATQCGESLWFWLQEKQIEWTIKDPRCREIFRAWWIEQKTGRAVMFLASSVLYSDPDGGVDRANEESCIQAIYEASHV